MFKKVMNGSNIWTRGQDPRVPYHNTWVQLRANADCEDHGSEPWVAATPGRPLRVPGTRLWLHPSLAIVIFKGVNHCLGCSLSLPLQMPFLTSRKSYEKTMHGYQSFWYQDEFIFPFSLSFPKYLYPSPRPNLSFGMTRHWLFPYIYVLHT